MSIKNILIVDDSKTSRAQLSKLLRDYDLQISTAESAEEAIDYLQQRQPDAIFLDHTMPGMDGLQALKILKDNPGTSLIPVAMYTSKDDQNYADQVRAEGAVDILYKPPTPTTLSGVFGALDKAYLSASANVAKMPTTPQRRPADAAVLSSIEDVVSSTVRVQLGSVVKNRLTPMLEEKIEGVGQQLLANTEKMASGLVDRALNVEANKLRVGLAADSEKLRASVEQSMQQQMTALEQKLQQQLGDMKKELNDHVVEFNEESARKIEQALSARVTLNQAKQSDKLRSLIYWLGGSALAVGLVALAMAIQAGS